GVQAPPGLTFRGWFEMCPHVHAGGVHVAKPGYALLGLAIHEVERGSDEFFVDSFHALFAAWSGVFNLLFAHLTELRIERVVVLVGCPALENAARAVLLAELWTLRIVRRFRLFLGVQMVEVAEKLVEAVHGRQVFVAVAEMVLTELAGGVAEVL